MPRQGLPVTAYALLGLLTFGDELTAYELKQRADVTLRFYWSSPAMSQVYSEVERLTEHGLITEVADDQRGTRYRISPAGRRALQRWMTQEPPRFPRLKHPVALRLLVGHVVEQEHTEAMLEAYLGQLEEQRRDLTEVRESLRGADAHGEAFFHPSLVAEWGLTWYDAEEAATRRTLERLRGDD